MTRLKLWRLQNSLTQGAAARRLGIGASTLALLESGRMQPTAAQVEHLRAVFGDEVDSLFEPVSEKVGVVA